MKIAVTYTGRDDKQEAYLRWLRASDIAVETEVVAAGSNTAHDIGRYDGLVLTGGGDIDPQLYGQAPGPLTKDVSRERDDFESSLLSAALDRGIPVLGICRGMQLVNVVLGGTLIQDLPSEGFEKHTGERHAPLMHPVTLRSDSAIARITGRSEGTVNSYHHQGIGTVAKGLQVTAVSRDGIAEALEWKETNGQAPLLLVQWHPERIADPADPFSAGIRERFLREAGATRTHGRSDASNTFTMG